MIELTSNIPDDAPLIIVHIEMNFPGSQKVKSYVAELAKDREIYVLFSELGQIADPLIQTSKQMHGEFAPAGMHGLTLDCPEIIVVGGYFKACLKNTINCLMEDSDKIHKIVLPMRAVFVGDQRNLLEYFDANYANNIEGFKTYVRSTFDANFSVDMVNEEVVLTVEDTHEDVSGFCC